MRMLALILMTIALVACTAPVTPTATPAITPSVAAPATPTLAPTTLPTVAASPAARQTPLIVAHRGGAALAPENTLAAFQNALQIGVDMVECDVHLTKDGEVIVMHDFAVSRTTNGSGEIGDLTLAEINKLNAAAKFPGGNFPAQSVPTLGELLDLVKGKADIQIEIKLGAGNRRYPGIERQVFDLINRRGMTDNVLIISFDFPTLQEVKAIDARFKTGALVNTTWMSSRALAAPERVVAEAVEASGADYFLPPFGTVVPALVTAVHARGLKIGTWTVNVPQDMQRLAGYGVDAITSDQPDVLRQTLGR